MFGYSFKPHKNLTIYPSYTYFLYSANASSFKSMFNHDFRLDIDFKRKYLGLGLSSGYLMGVQNTFI
jgi:hypothetical protein